MWAPDVGQPGDVGGFTRRDHGDFSLGYANTALEVRDGNAALTMVEGSPCPIHKHMHAATTIHFKCDTSVFGAGEPKLIAQLPPPANQSCYFFIEWRTHVACPTRARGGNWGVISILASIAGILFFVYIIAGMFYNYFILGLRGGDVFPRYSLFSFRDTVQLFRRCIGRVKEQSESLHFGSGGMGSWGSRTNGRYRGLASSHEEEAGMLSGPPGYLDEEDEEEEEHQNGSRPQGMDSDGTIRL
ncbi:hypothetical protein NM688_g6286 [Phlebia brevispora]|uniref:Uncharacterized protein n=1 Tax=Phlebia brevispora TaxID=194682 RepID=A0ACC1SHP1_9APHY|nr:hypothetical protein NM688_g6286 [Phlebia brevispora]